MVEACVWKPLYSGVANREPDIKDPNSGKRIVRYAKTQKEAEKKLEDIKFDTLHRLVVRGENIQWNCLNLNHTLTLLHAPFPLLARIIQSVYPLD